MFCAIEAILRRQGAEVAGSTVAIQGCGAVGAGLAGRLAQAGASLVVSDLDEARANALAQRYSARVASPEAILKEPVEILAPCALGGVLNAETISHICAPFVIGAANNQLATPEDAERLAERGIVYAPDYVVNAGGIIAVMQEYREEASDVVGAKVRAIGPRIETLIAQAEAKRMTPATVAQARVDEILAGAARLRAPAGA